MKPLREIIKFRDIGEIVDPDHTVLVIWHGINAMINSAFNKEGFLENLKHLIERARTNNVPVIYTKTTPFPRAFDSSWRLYAHMIGHGIDDPEKIPQRFIQSGNLESEIYSGIGPMNDDLVLNTYTGSIFIGTFFENLMKNRGINTILFAGMATEMGIDTSARESGCRGFYTVVIEDCVSSRNKEFHESALKILKKICLVLLSKDVIKHWKATS
jgi:nicotinamidase-related amidase